MSEIPIYEISAALGHCLKDDSIVSKIERNDHNNHNNAILVSSNVHWAAIETWSHEKKAG